ncbi:TIGR02206 family membrane protein [Paraclostridium bifermentans]|uniref:YwaF family protein n=1 Tax=Paraclostridium bifermentans TaxID=1490 RepID=UPI00241D5D1E|nr:TIGR02206 family membrane protein [Paraclostridium bifermentans]
MNKLHYFFRTSIERNNFSNFGVIHLILLGITLLGIAIIVNKKRENRLFELSIGIVLLIQQTTLYLWYLKGNYHLVQEGLPLFHCRIAIILIAIGMIFKKDFMMKMGSYWGIFGSISALLFPGLDPFVFPHMTQFSYFIGHILLLWGSIYLLTVKKVGMSKSDFKKVFIITNLYHIAMFNINNLINSNYAYMKSSPIGIGNKLNPILYGFIVMMIFNSILSLEYFALNNKKEFSVEECYEIELIKI